MTEFFILLSVVVAITIIGYFLRGHGGAARQRVNDKPRLTGRDEVEALRTGPDAPPAVSGLMSATEAARQAGKGAGLFKDATASAAGVPYERAADEIEQITADLAIARREAERNAEQLASRAAEALAAIQAVTAAHGGAVPGDGTDRCPPRYPVKATMAQMLYETPDQLTYDVLIPDICLESVAAAEAAGFSGSNAQPTTASGATVIERTGGMQAEVGTEPERQ